MDLLGALVRDLACSLNPSRILPADSFQTEQESQQR